MARSIPAAILALLLQPEVYPFYAVEMLFDSGAVRLWTGHGDRTIDGQTYLGAGNLLSISGIDEVNDLSAKAATISLNGINSSIVSLSLTEPYQRRPVRILFGVDTPDKNGWILSSGNWDDDNIWYDDAWWKDSSVVANYFVEIFGGYMNTMAIEDSGETSNITLTVESRLIELNRPRVRRYTHESQKSRYPTDTFFSFVADLQDKDIVWGRKIA
jgi:hypothetical protein